LLACLGRSRAGLTARPRPGPRRTAGSGGTVAHLARVVRGRRTVRRKIVDRRAERSALAATGSPATDSGVTRADAALLVIAARSTGGQAAEVVRVARNPVGRGAGEAGAARQATRATDRHDAAARRRRAGSEATGATVRYAVEARTAPEPVDAHRPAAARAL